MHVLKVWDCQQDSFGGEWATKCFAQNMILWNRAEMISGVAVSVRILDDWLIWDPERYCKHISKCLKIQQISCNSHTTLSFNAWHLPSDSRVQPRLWIRTVGHIFPFCHLLSSHSSLNCLRRIMRCTKKSHCTQEPELLGGMINQHNWKMSLSQATQLVTPSWRWGHFEWFWFHLFTEPCGGCGYFIGILRHDQMTIHTLHGLYSLL